MSNYEFTNDEFYRMGDYLLAELAARENGPISESFAKATIAKQNILSESFEVLEENAKHTYFEWHNYGVTVNRNQFEKVYTHPDEYPTPHDILRALHFPEDILRRPANSVRAIVGGGNNPRKSSLLGWYNQNSSPVHQLASLQNRKATYSHAAKLAARAEDDGTPIQPTKKQIDAGKRTVNNRTAKVVDAINQQDIFEGEFYNNMTRIPRKNWNHWLKFWDKRMGSVEPNKKKALGKLIGRTWGKTFLLGYQVDRTVIYEIWYNSLDSSFSVYDMHGVEMGNPTPTLQEAIRDLIHVIAQVSDSDKANFGVGRTGADLASSLQRTLGNVMDQDVGVMKREQDLRVKELVRQAKDEHEQDEKFHKRRVVSRAKNIKQARKQRQEDEYQQMLQQTRSDVASGIKRDLERAREERKAAATVQARKYWTARIEELENELSGDKTKRTSTKFKPADKEQEAKNKKEEERVRQYDIARAVRSGQDIMTQLQNDAANREIDLEIAKKKEEADRLERAFRAVSHNTEVYDPADLEPIDPSFGIPPTMTGINDDGTPNRQYQELAKELEKQLNATYEEINKMQSFKKKNSKKKKKRGLGDMPWQSPRQRGVSESEETFSNMLFGDSNPLSDPEMPSNPRISLPDLNDKEITREIKQVKRQAEQSPYNKALLLSDITGSLKSYSETKIRKSNMRATIGNWVRDTIAPTRDKAQEKIKPGFWSRIGMFFRGQTFRADFIIGWSFADRLNLEIWYVTERDPQNKSKLVSSYYVYDINAQMVIRKYIPYYRIAISTVSAKLGVANNQG